MPLVLLRHVARIEFKVAVFYTARRRKWKNLCPCYDNFMPCCLYRSSLLCEQGIGSAVGALFLFPSAPPTGQFVPIFERRYIHQARPMVITLKWRNSCSMQYSTSVSAWPAQPWISSLCHMSALHYVLASAVVVLLLRLAIYNCNRSITSCICFLLSLIIKFKCIFWVINGHKPITIVHWTLPRDILQLQDINNTCTLPLNVT